MSFSMRLFMIASLACAMPFAAQAQDAGEDLSPFMRDLVYDTRMLMLPAADLPDSLRAVADETDGMALRETEDSFILSVTSDVLFAFDSAELSETAQTTLSDIAALLKANPGPAVNVVGHTDSKGEDAYNQTLSEERAASVMAFLQENDVAAERLSASGRGEAEPVAPNEVDGADNPEGRAQNRRVEFILPKED
ncbi:OmpA family protein [Paracoccaceae bacterium GXU_MW_L88]